MRLDVPASKLLRVLLWSVAAIHLLSLGFTIVYHGFGVYDLIPYWGRIVKFFYVDKEQNLPTWFSSGLLLLAALLLWQLGGADRRFHRHWRVLAVVFTGLSLDEFSQFHELGAKVEVLDAGGASYLSWLVLAAPLVLVLGLSYLRLLLALPPRVRWLMIGAAGLFLGGAAGIEVLGAYSGRENIGFTPGWASMGYVLAASAEELCEMLGVVLFVYAAALHLQHRPTAPPRPSPRRATGKEGHLHIATGSGGHLPNASRAAGQVGREAGTGTDESACTPD